MLLAMLATLTIIVSVPPLPPAEAAAVMARLRSPANVTGVDLTRLHAPPPVIVLLPATQTLPSPSTLAPTRRLDGTSLWQPPMIYGAVAFGYPFYRSVSHVDGHRRSDQ